MTMKRDEPGGIQQRKYPLIFMVLVALQEKSTLV